MRAAGFEPDLQAYNILLSAHASRGDINAADEVLDSMQEDRCKPDQYTYSSAIQSCEPTGDVIHAQAHFQKMRQLGIRPTDVVCNALIAVQASVGDVEGVQKTLKEMKSLGVAPDRVSFNSAIATGVKAPHASTRWFYEMKQSGFQPDATTYTSVVNSSVSKRDMAEAEKWIVRATEAELILLMFGVVLAKQLIVVWYVPLSNTFAHGFGSRLKGLPPGLEMTLDMWQRCEMCGQRATATCSKCRASHYCGQACQRRSWASPSVKLPLSQTRSCGSLRSVITSHDVVSQAVC
eukprot:symbB.v1.2.006325.t1/scaffold378.1/size217351/3